MKLKHEKGYLYTEVFTFDKGINDRTKSISFRSLVLHIFEPSSTRDGKGALSERFSFRTQKRGYTRNLLLYTKRSRGAWVQDADHLAFSSYHRPLTERWACLEIEYGKVDIEF